MHTQQYVCVGGRVCVCEVGYFLQPPTECIVRPGLEPVDSTAVDEGGELAEAVAEGIPNGAEGKDDM